MKRPFICLSVALLGGILWGLPEVASVYKLVSLLLALYWHIRSFFSRGGKTAPLLFLFILSFILFFTGFLRARHISLEFSERSSFFRGYEATNPGEFDYALYLKGEGISSEQELEEYYNGYSGSDPIRSGISSLKSRLEACIDRYMTPKDAGIYKAILLGDKADMDEGIKELYQASGISHIIAVSGLHISLVGMSVFKLFKALGARTDISALSASISALLYVSLTGSSGSALRAFIMLICRFAAMLRKRSYDMATAIAAAMMLLVLDRPYIVLQSGFQLSFLAVLGIALIGGELRLFLERVRKRGLPSMAGTVISNLSVQLATLPAIAFHFFVFPVYGIGLNFAVIPLMTFVMYSGIGVVFLGMLSELIPVLEPFAVAVGGAGHYILELYELLCSLSTALPYGRIIFGRPGHMHIVIYYAALLMIVYSGRAMVTPGLIKDSLLKWIRRSHITVGKDTGDTGSDDSLASKGPGSRRYIRIAAGMMLSALLMLPCLLYRLPEAKRGLDITALDVGQGDCFIVRYMDRTYMFDGGSAYADSIGEDVIEAYLMSKGIRSIDKIFVSHGDEDHISGIRYLMSEESLISIKELVLPGAAAVQEGYEELKAIACSMEGVALDYSTEGSAGYLDADIRNDIGNKYSGYKPGGSMEEKAPVLYCLYGGRTDSDEINRHSPVYLLCYGEFSMLFTGDMTEDEEKELYKKMEGLGDILLPYGLTVLKVPHHGSKTSSSDMLLKAIRPSIALISYGRDNPFGHPHSLVTDRLERYGARILGTGDHGAISLWTDGEELVLSSFFL